MLDASARNFALLSLVVAACALTGGSSRATMPAMLLLRPLLALAVVILLFLPGPRDWRGLRLLTGLFVLFALSMLAQLVPIPVDWWLGLAGRARYAVGVEMGGAAFIPLSLTPDLTLNSILALLPAACAILAYAGMRPEHRWKTVWILIALAAATLLVALAQIGGGPGGVAYLYGRHQDEVAGLLANRNHQAVLLGTALPLMAVAARHAAERRRPLIVVTLACLGVATLPMILLTGSRQGLLLGALALVTSLALIPRPRFGSPGRSAMAGPVVWAALGGLAAIVVAVAVFTDRAVSIERLTTVLAADDARWRNLPTVLTITGEFFPWGIGYGAFDPVYRGFEPDSLLHGTYFNHVHNDVLESVLTGGLPAVLLMIALLVLIVSRAIRMVGADAALSRRSYFLDRAALALVLLFAAASLVDYPLRTPIVSVTVALALCWLAAPPAVTRKRERAGSAADRRETT